MKKFLKIIFIIFIIIWLIFWLWYYSKIKRDLVDYNISEKIVVKFEDDDNKYLVNLNDWSYIKYDWRYKEYDYDFEIDWDNDDDVRSLNHRKFYNQNNTYYFDYRIWIYNQNNERIFRFINSWFFEAYWSQDWKYLIARSWYIARMFGLFLQVETANTVFTIVEPESWKMKQLILWKPWDKFINIKSILWYIE